MTCSGCGKPCPEGEPRCPHCGRPVQAASGVFQTSTVLIHSGGTEGVYRSVEEVPPLLRTRLLKSTNGLNSATLLIADRRGRREIARAMRSMPVPLQRRLVQALLGQDAGSSGIVGLSRGRKIFLVGLLAAMVLALAWMMFVR
jgi:hypothetical protein